MSDNYSFWYLSLTRNGTIKLRSEHLDDYGGDQIYNVCDLKTIQS